MKKTIIKSAFALGSVMVVVGCGSSGGGSGSGTATNELLSDVQAA